MELALTHHIGGAHSDQQSGDHATIGRHNIRVSNAPLQWKPGDPLHWEEQSNFDRIRYFIIRALTIAHFFSSICYLQYRGRKTLSVFISSQRPIWVIVQILFFLYECFIAFFGFTQSFEHWNVTKRNSICFNEIDPSYIEPLPSQDMAQETLTELRHFPSVDVVIPCYKEDLSLVRAVVTSALNLDYPKEKLSVYLCDDGNEQNKKEMIDQLKKNHGNVFYVNRPTHDHAKPGNVNFTLDRTSSHLVAQLDADFIARRNMLQRLVPYFYIWSPSKGSYVFNSTVSVVQSPQHYRNISPSDHDYFDQRVIYYNNVTLPGKDWFNASTMVGTANLINRKALVEADHFPYHSFGDDTALSLIFHGLGYQSYFVNESLATGLCPSSLRGNFAQRARWYVSDSQIFFSKHGPFTQSGLNLIQRTLYLNMFLQRLLSAYNLFVEVTILLILITGLSVADVTEPKAFFSYFLVQLGIGSLIRLLVCLGTPGLFKSVAAHEAFEVIFRYATTKGIILTIFNRKMLRWKVAEKKTVNLPDKPITSSAADVQVAGQEEQGENLSKKRKGVFFDPDVITENHGNDISNGRFANSKPPQFPAVHNRNTVLTIFHANNEHTETDDIMIPSSETLKDFSDQLQSRKKEDNTDGTIQEKSAVKNLKRCWYNILMSFLMIFAIIWALCHKDRIRKRYFVAEFEGQLGKWQYSDTVSVTLAIAFGLSNLIPHLLVLFLCVKKEYLKPFEITDFDSDRCDQFTKNEAGADRVPFSPILLISWLRALFVFVGLVYTIFTSFSERGVFIPNSKRS